MKKSIIASSLILCTTLSFSLDLGGIAKGVMDNAGTVQSLGKSTTTNSNLSDSTVSSGLKEALKSGAKFATTQLGSQNGYLNNPMAKIPLPNNLSSAEKVIRSAGGDKMVDDLINSMNGAATKAAPKTVDIFLDAIDKMSVTDAQNILNGGNNAATNYFKANTT